MDLGSRAGKPTTIPSPTTVEATSVPADISVVTIPSPTTVDATFVPTDVNIVSMPTRNSFGCLRVEDTKPEAKDEVNDRGPWEVVAKILKSAKKTVVTKGMMRAEKKDTRRNKNIVIIGDSLIKRMDRQCDAEGNVVRLCLPGCR